VQQRIPAKAKASPLRYFIIGRRKDKEKDNKHPPFPILPRSNCMAPRNYLRPSPFGGDKPTIKARGNPGIGAPPRWPGLWVFDPFKNWKFFLFFRENTGFFWARNVPEMSGVDRNGREDKVGPGVFIFGGTWPPSSHDSEKIRAPPPRKRSPASANGRPDYETPALRRPSACPCGARNVRAWPVNGPRPFVRKMNPRRESPHNILQRNRELHESSLFRNPYSATSAEGGAVPGAVRRALRDVGPSPESLTPQISNRFAAWRRNPDDTTPDPLTPLFLFSLCPPQFPFPPFIFFFFENSLSLSSRGFSPDSVPLVPGRVPPGALKGPLYLRSRGGPPK